MGIQVVVLAPACRATPCLLREALRAVAGVDACVSWPDWRADAETGEGLFVLLGGRECEANAYPLPEWYQRFREAGVGNAAIRGWPILVVSPHAERWVRDLWEETGTDLHAEPSVSLVEVPHDVATVQPAVSLCEDERVVEVATAAVQRTLLASPWASHGDHGALRSYANLRQGCSVLEHAAARMHELVHTARSTAGGAVVAGWVGDADQFMRGLGTSLDAFLDPAEVERFVQHAVDFLGEVGRGGDPVHEVAALLARYTEESRAALNLGAAALRRMADSRVHVLLLDDDHQMVETLVARVPKGRSLSVWPIHMVDVAAVIRKAKGCGGDPSEAVAERAYRQVVEYLDGQLQARDEWSRDSTRFVLVVDVRLDPMAPAAGLGVIRRIRDSHPFVATIALTVRRGLASVLSDEGADGYVVKTGDRNATADAVWSAVSGTLGCGGHYGALPGADDVLEDTFLREIVERKYLLTRASEVDGAARLLFCRIEDLPKASGDTGPTTVLGCVVEPDLGPARALGLLRMCRETLRRSAVVLHRAPRKDGTRRLYPTSVERLDRALQPGVATRYDVRWTLLVPRSWRCGGLSLDMGEAEIARLRRAVFERFGGATAGDARGVWVRPRDQSEVQDVLERIEVLGRRTEAGRAHLLGLAERLVREFGQEEVFLQEEALSNWTLWAKGRPRLLPAVDSQGRVAVPFAFEPALATDVDQGTRSTSVDPENQDSPDAV